MSIRRFLGVAFVTFASAALAAAQSPGDQSLQPLTGPAAGDPEAIVRGYVSSHLDQLGLTPDDVSGMQLASRTRTADVGVSHLYFDQRLDGYAIYRAVLNANVAADGRLLSLFHSFHRDARALAGGAERSPRLSAVDAIEWAALHLGGRADRARLALERAAPEHPRGGVYGDGGFASRPIPAYAVWVAGPGGLRLSWSLLIQPRGQDDLWDLKVDARDGALLASSNLTRHASYRVFPSPFEAPSIPGAAHQLVADPQDAATSPFGWHDTNGSAGAEFTDTQGNNAKAQEDIDANNTGGTRPAGGAGLAFDYAFDPALAPAGGTNRSAAIVNLFYWNNVAHDILARHGFDEGSGNFQTTNYLGAGAAGDEVQADAQDGSGTDNANFSTPPEPASTFGKPRMQMYVWSPPDHELEIHSPAGIAAVYPAAGSTFGAVLSATGTRRNLKLANAGNLDGCLAFPAGYFDLPGGGMTPDLFAVVNRGNCDFVVKTGNARSAGADGIIVVNNVAEGGVFTMGGTLTGAKIGAIMISKEDGDLIKPYLDGTLGTTADGTMRKPASVATPARDSDLDAGVIVHEYGHGVSVRLTGGPTNSACLDNAEQEGEGWSDFLALTLTARATDSPSTGRGIGTYLSFQGPSGAGIRSFRYTTDTTLNPQTYDSIETTGGQPHAVGEIWAGMLWEVYWNLVAEHGWSSDLYTGSGGNNRALRLVIDALKLQPCEPTFVQARDAVLQADVNRYAGANSCLIWKGFAKRGLGFSATAGSSTSVTDGAQAFDLPAACSGFNVPPVAVPDAYEADFETPLVVPANGVLGNDADPDSSGALSAAVVTPPANAQAFALAADGGFSYTPDDSFSGSDSFTYTASDGGETSVPVTVTITVAGADEIPEAVDDSATVLEDAPATAVPVLGNDTNSGGDPLSIAEVTQPAAGAVVITGGGTGLTYQPAANACNNPPGGAPDTFTYTLSPGGSIGTVSMTVTCVDDAPAAVADAATVLEDAAATAIAVLANDTDIDAGPISITAVTQPAAGAVVITGLGTGLTYQPTANACNNPPGGAPDTFTYTLSPGGSIGTVSMTVTCAADAPVANDDTDSTAEGVAVDVAVLANDTDPDGTIPTVQSVTQPANGAASINPDGTVQVTPAPCFSGTLSFQYTITDGALTDSADVTVDVAADGASCFHTLAPCRIYDSRTGAGAFGDDETRTIQVTGLPPSECQIPAGAVAAAFNLTVATPGGTGILTLFPADQTAAGTSTLGFTAGVNRGNNSVMGLSPAGAVKAQVAIDGGTVDVIIDVTGWFE